MSDAAWFCWDGFVCGGIAGALAALLFAFLVGRHSEPEPPAAATRPHPVVAKDSIKASDLALPTDPNSFVLPRQPDTPFIDTWIPGRWPHPADWRAGFYL